MSGLCTQKCEEYGFQNGNLKTGVVSDEVSLVSGLLTQKCEE